MLRYKEVNISDHELAKHLNDKGQWDFYHMGNQTVYTLKGGRLGYSIFNNSTCERTTFLVIDRVDTGLIGG